MNAFPVTFEKHLKVNTGLDSYMNYLILDELRKRWPQINDHTSINIVDQPIIFIPVIPELELQQPRKPLRRKKKGYRWQFHRAFYMLMDLPTIEEWGWETVYVDAPSTRYTHRNIHLIGLGVKLDGHPYAALQNWMAYFHYDAVGDRLFLYDPRRTSRFPNGGYVSTGVVP